MAIIDWDQFNENFQYYDKEIINELIIMFVDEYDDRISNLQKNIDQGDFVTLAFNAHSYKGVIANYMAPRAVDAAGKLEEAAKIHSEEVIPEIFNGLKGATAELLAELKAYLQKSE